MEQIRLNKYLAQCGVCSRREADRLIARGDVLVNGRTAGMGCIVDDADEIRIGGKAVKGRDPKKTFVFYKPVGVVCTERDAHAEEIVNDWIHEPMRVTYAGRLDQDAEGLLILSNDGELIDAMMRGANRHEKEYLVMVNREVTESFLNKITNGIYLGDLGVTTRKCNAEKLDHRIFRLILTQGLNRQIKRMCRECGYHVRAIKRVRVMNIRLGQLRPGEYREITGEELRVLYKAAGIKPLA